VLDDYFTTAPFTFDAQYGIFYSQYVRAASMDIARVYGTPPKDTSLAEVLHAEGYRTALFHSSFIHFINMFWQFKGKGFDAITSAEDLVSPSHPGWSWGASEEDTIAAAVQGLEANKGSKFFLVYNAVTPHHPYHAPLEARPFPGTALFDNYRNAVFYEDRNVGTLLAALERMGVASHTLVVVTSDHGETADAEALGGGHGIRFSTDELRVPMFFASEALFPEAVHSALPANHLDFAPTLSSLLGTPPMEGALGRNLLAPEVMPRLLYIERAVGSYTGLIDGDKAYALNVSDGLKRLYRVTPGGFEPVTPSVAETSALEVYEREVAVFDDRVTLRHLERAGR
jgi:arylsulfatase A-like enzyme